MSQENKKLVMFDFDGVLANTVEGSFQIHKSLNPNLTREIYDSWVDGNFWEEFQKAIDAGYKVPENYREKYKLNLALLTIPQVLAESIILLSKKYILAVVSSTLSPSIAHYLKQQGMNDKFSDILGAEVSRSKVIKIRSLLGKYNVDREEAVFITDTLGDIKEATECEVPCIAVLWGQHNRETLEKGNPKAIIQDPRDLIDAIENVLK